MKDTELIDLLKELTAYPAETQWIEFKKGKGCITDEQIGEYISAMSNGATVANKPFGYLVWGVENDLHEIVGTNFSFVGAKHGGNQDLELFLRSCLNPKINFEILEFDYQNRHVVLLRIPAAKGEPVNFQKKPYIRIGSNKTDLRNYPELMRIMYEGSPDDYSFGNRTPEKYRNQWLASAMVNLGMIDRLGYGIHSLCVSQMKRYFPMPDYDLSQSNKVILKIFGQSIDENYSKILIKRGDLSLQEAILLDRVQKQLDITDLAASELRKKNLIEGRKPNYFIGAKISQTTGQKAAYTKNKGLNKQYYLDLILESIKQHGNLSRKDIDELLWEKLPDVYSDSQKRNKITNLIAELRQKRKIANQGSFAFPKWTKL